mmetsp:Transcript_2963/g.13381  ORF Transcript_2963/g.13381 Transcript_2963/m.13381 type:complete len:288 (+) Transcript_2963:1459-2322(+)
MDSLRDFTKYLPSKVLVKVVTRKSFARFHVHTTDESTPSRTHVMRPLRVEERVGNELGVDVLRVESVGHDLEDDGLGVVQDILDLVERRGVRGDEAVVERPRLLQVLMAVRDGDGTVLGGELAARDLGTDDGAVDARAVVQLVALGGREQGNPFLVRHLEAEGVEADAAALLPGVGVSRLWVGAAEEVEVVRPLRQVGADPSGVPSLLPERVGALAGVGEELLDRLARALGGGVAVLVGNQHEHRDGLAAHRFGVAASQDGEVDDLGEGWAGGGASDLAGVQPSFER